MNTGDPCRYSSGGQPVDIRRRNFTGSARESELPIVPLELKDSITLGEGRGNAFIVFPKKGSKEIAVEAGNSRVVRDLQRELYQKAKQDLRKPLEEDDRKAVFGKTERTV
jgi:hypothetical protein